MPGTPFRRPRARDPFTRARVQRPPRLQGLRQAPANRSARRRTAPKARPRASMRPRPRERVATTQAGRKPFWALSGWAGIPIIGSLISLIRRIVFPQEHLRQAKRAFVGPQLGSVWLERARRKSLPLPREQGRILRARTPGRTAVIGHQFARRGKLHGVPKHQRSREA